MPSIKIYVGAKLVHDFDWEDITGYDYGQNYDSQIFYHEKVKVYPLGISLKSGKRYDFMVEDPKQYAQYVEQLREGKDLADVTLRFDPAQNTSYSR